MVALRLYAKMLNSSKGKDQRDALFRQVATMGEPHWPKQEEDMLNEEMWELMEFTTHLDQVQDFLACQVEKMVNVADRWHHVAEHQVRHETSVAFME